MNARFVVGLGIAAMAVAGCGGGGTNTAADTTQAHPGGSASGDQVVATASADSTTTCQTKDLTISLTGGEGTAGSVYEPLRFTNSGATACTLYGYPGVAFVKTGSGAQVGAAATRNAQHSAQTVSLAPGASAEAIVQIVDHGNYGPDQCSGTQVGGFRVYPPGNKAAAYVSFADATVACSTDVAQLTVEAVTPAS